MLADLNVTGTVDNDWPVTATYQYYGCERSPLRGGNVMTAAKRWRHEYEARRRHDDVNGCTTMRRTLVKDLTRCRPDGAVRV